MSIGSPEGYMSLLKQLYKQNIDTVVPVTMGLDNMMRLNEKLGFPLKDKPIVHITGTNGKGSVAYKISQCLLNSGCSKVGLFVSPHISSFRERIQVNHELLSETDFESLASTVLDVARKNEIPASFFELSTAMAFLHYQRSNCDAVSLEVGCGGRLDATNVIIPSLSIITTVQLDHMRILGDTIEKIATEKAGIMKPGVDVLVGPGCPIEHLREIAKKVGSNLYTICDVLTEKEIRYHDKNQDIDELNCDIVAAALKLLKKKGGIYTKIPEDLTSLERFITSRPPCRFQIIPQQVLLATGEEVTVKVVLDVAHNEEAIGSMKVKLNRYFPDITPRVVFAMATGKRMSNCLTPILEIVKNDDSMIHFVAANHPRARTVEELKKALNDLIGNERIEPASKKPSTMSIGDTIKTVLVEAAKSDKLVLVCGSAFIMPEARAAVGIVEPIDGDVLASLGAPPAKDRPN